jgi:hypothetical protein
MRKFIYFLATCFIFQSCYKCEMRPVIENGSFLRDTLTNDIVCYCSCNYSYSEDRDWCNDPLPHPNCK